MSNRLQEKAIFTFSHAAGIGATKESNDPKPNKKAIHLCRTIEAFNVLGYIPGVSVIVGIARMIFASIAAKKFPELVGMQCLRGALEILCLGPLMIVSDAITSIWLACRKP